MQHGNLRVGLQMVLSGIDWPRPGPPGLFFLNIRLRIRHPVPGLVQRQKEKECHTYRAQNQADKSYRVELGVGHPD
jgi:hypothetical protein